jgi:hypothetical protein
MDGGSPKMHSGDHAMRGVPSTSKLEAQGGDEFEYEILAANRPSQTISIKQAEQMNER